MATNAACTGAAASVLAYPGYVANTAAENGTDSTMSGSQVVSFDNRYLFTKFTADNNTGGNVPQYLSCVDTTTNATCTGAGWAALNTFTGVGGVTPPTSVSDYLPTGGSGSRTPPSCRSSAPAGTVTGVCTADSTVVTASVLVCFSLTAGATVGTPPTRRSGRDRGDLRPGARPGRRQRDQGLHPVLQRNEQGLHLHLLRLLHRGCLRRLHPVGHVGY